MFMGMIITIYQFYCVQGRVAIPMNGSCYYTIVVRQEKVIPIAKITNCIYITFPTIVLYFTYKCPDKITGIKWEMGRGRERWSGYGNCVTWLVLT